MDDQLGGVFGPVSSFKTTARTVKTPPISPHSLVTYIIFYPYSLLRQSGSFFSSSPSYMINTNMMNYQRILAGLLLAIGLSIVNSKGIRALQANVPVSSRVVYSVIVMCHYVKYDRGVLHLLPRTLHLTSK